VAETTTYPDVYGWIGSGGSSAHDESGAENPCHVTRTTTEDYERAYVSFDTSVIPDSATIEAALLQVYIHDITTPIGINLSSLGAVVYYDHDKIGAAITSDDWAFSAFAGYKYLSGWPTDFPKSAEVIVVTASINVDGDSDYEIRDASVWSDSVPGPSLHYYPRYGSPASKMWLTVTYSVPGGFFNRWNWRLPALPGFSGILSALVLETGEIQITERFYPRPVEA